MVKITNPLGDFKTGKQGEAVYQGTYGQQMRRTSQPKRAIPSEKQIAHRQLYREALQWRKSLSLANRRYLEAYCIANWVVDRYKIPLPWHRFALKIYLEPVHFIIVKNPPGFSGKDPLYEYYNTGDDDWSVFYEEDMLWIAQTFTPLASHKLTLVKMKFYRYGLPGTITVSIRPTDENGHPTGTDLCTGTTDGNTLTEDDEGEWREITMSASAPLSANTKYAIVVRALQGDGWNCAWAKQDSTSPTYQRGNAEWSYDSGSTWYGDGVVFMFEEWGEPPPTPTPLLLHVRHPALLTVVQKRQGQTVKAYDTLSSLDDKYLTGQVGLDVEQGDEIEATTVAGILYKYQV